MDFWGLKSEGYDYDLLSDDEELDGAVEGGVVDGSENMLFEFDLDIPFGLEEDVLFLDKQVMERFQEVESALSDIIQKPNETIPGVENLEVGDGIFSGDDMNLASPDCGLSSFSLLGENESWSGNSSLLAINLEMGRQEEEEEEETENDEISEKRFEAFVADFSLPDKQANVECLSSTKVTCQVQGCNADLTSSKDYYKRHRVCPLDTKKAEVTVNGIQKRFCQQCSRFHLLNEFDDDKRSCRKRLAGHNKRRRKPRFENRNHRPHKFQPYQCQGSRPDGAMLPPRRHLLTDLLPARVLFPDIIEQINGSRLQSGSVYGPVPANIPSMRNPCPGPVYYSPPVRPSTVQNSSGVLDASYALSLLSNQPQFSSPYFATTSPVIIQGHNIFHNPVNKVNFASPHMLHSSSMNFLQGYQIDPRMLTGAIHPVSSMISSGGNQNGGSLCSNCSYCHMPRQHGSTVNLRQLSFNLSRVEHQRNVP